MEIATEKQSNFAYLLLLIVLLVGAYRFYEYYVEGNYVMEVYTSCDPALHSCFVADEEIADPGFQAGPYLKVSILGRFAPDCLEEHSCSDFSCENIEQGCSLTYCSPEGLGEGESCLSEIPELEGEEPTEKEAV